MATTPDMHRPTSVDSCFDLPPELWFTIMTEIKAKEILSLCSVRISKISFYDAEL